MARKKPKDERADRMAQHREVGPEGAGSPGDVRDRFRGAYRPGANPPTVAPIGNPLEQIPKIIKKIIKGVRKRAR